ncbi:GntR family transcriptional regulator [Streptomyces sp. NPDC053560]|uniref:GntR family transcriptional regulator n=1 Tax=Streptomyces sp. NPDC053560 TaxID=3365711 RepID=UPI0037CE8167
MVPRPDKFRVLAEEIITRIKAKDPGFRPGDMVPSARELVRTKGISSATAARVLSEVRARGFAESKPGVGTVVIPPKPAPIGALRAAQPTAGPGERVEILHLRRLPATGEVADALGVDEGDEVAERCRRYLDAGGVVTVSRTWITGATADAAPEFLEPEPLPKLTFGLIEERTGRRVAKRRDTYELRPVPGELAPLLGEDVAEGDMHLAAVNIYWDQNGDPTEYAVDFVGPGRSLSADVDVE